MDMVTVVSFYSGLQWLEETQRAATPSERYRRVPTTCSHTGKITPGDGDTRSGELSPSIES